MNKRALVVGAVILMVLTGCGEDAGDISRDRWAGSEGLRYTYPVEAQREVAVSAPLLLRFSAPVTDTDPTQEITVTPVNGEPEDAVPLAFSFAEGGRVMRLEPESALEPRRDYRLSIGELGLEEGTSQARQIEFRTAALEEGPGRMRGSLDELEIERRIPDGEDFPVMDFSSHRFQFSQPLDEDSVRPGETVMLLDSEAGSVAAHVLVRRNRLTIDPREDLVAGAEYTLVLDGLTGRSGDELPRQEYSIVPEDSEPRETMLQQVVDSEGGVLTSPLTGDPVNLVPFESVLLGDDNASQQEAVIAAELAFIPDFPEISPLRVPRGTRLSSEGHPPVDVRIGGTVPAGFDSGDVEVRLLSDAVGYMMPNPYSNAEDAPRLIRLFMDVAIATENPRASGGVTQDQLHLELVGTAMVEEGQLRVNAVSVVEPSVLGVESARSVLSFHMRGFRDQTSAPSPPDDVDPPELIGWMPGSQQSAQRPDDPVMLLFSEPLDADTVSPGENLLLKGPGGDDIPFGYRTDGASLTLRPEQPLEDGVEHEVSVTEGITDLAGNPLAAETLAFELPDYIEADPHAPVVLTSYPGFPCITMNMNLAADNAGRCLGGSADDDHLPLQHLPANRAIQVTFSQEMDPGSINVDTVRVERVDASTNAIGDVEGELHVGARSLTFVPDEPWEEDALYRYTLKSRTSDPDCGVDSVCDHRGLPLQTRMIASSPASAPAPTEGGFDLSVYFRGAAPSETVLQPLRNLPTADTNANFIADDDEPVVSESPDALYNSTLLARNPDANPDQDGTAASNPGEATGDALDDINIGCGFDEDDGLLECQDDQFLHLSAGLNVEIEGHVPPEEIDPADDAIPQKVAEEGGVRVHIHPTRLAFSGVMVHINESEAAENLSFTALPSFTGPQVMRIRYTCDAAASGDCDGTRQGLVPGWIVEEEGEARLYANLGVYVDAPRLEPLVENHNMDPPEMLDVGHDLRSLPLEVELAGAIDFFEDGRLRIEQVNQNALEIDITVDVEGLLEGMIHLKVPEGGTVLNFISPPLQR